jgi:hypothetical protein
MLTEFSIQNGHLPRQCKLLFAICPRSKILFYFLGKAIGNHEFLRVIKDSKYVSGPKDLFPPFFRAARYYPYKTVKTVWFIS